VLNQLLGSPGLFFAALLPLCFALLAISRTELVAINLARPMQWLALAVLGVAVLGHVYFATAYLYSPNFSDHIEPNTAIVAWLYANGGQIYHPVDAAERYAFLYGPLAYMATGSVYQLFGASTLTAKLAGFMCLLLTMVTLGLVARRAFPQRWYPCLIILGYFSLLALFFKNHSFWSKPDPFMVAAASLALLACLLENKRRGWLLLGVAVGLAVNAKITGVIYFLPFAAWIYARDGFRSVPIAAGAAALVAVLPFLFPAYISLPNYMAWLQSAGGHGLSKVLLVQNGLFILFACIPLLAFMLWQRVTAASDQWLVRHKLVAAASVLAALLVLIAASKPGSGAHHFLPFLPALAFLTASAVVTVRRDSGSTAQSAYIFWAPLTAMFIAASVKTAFAVYYGLRVVSSQVAGEELVQDIDTVIAAYPDRNIHMGSGDGTKPTLTFVRNHLVYAGNPYLLDSAALMDFQFSGLEIPPATLASLLNDKTAVWLIPQGQEPFTIVNWYYRHDVDGGFLFSEEFRRAFRQGFRKQASTSYYDIYVSRDEVSSR
jgi:hypothetical protein